MSETSEVEIQTEERKITRMIEVRLQPTELADLGVRAGGLSGEIAVEQADFDSIKRTKSAALKQKQTELDQMLEKLNQKTEQREVECVQRLDYATNTCTVYHGEDLVEERAITAEELQMHFPEAKHGIVEEEDTREAWPPTEEDKKQDLVDTMKAEKKRNKPSLVDMAAR